LRFFSVSRSREARTLVVVCGLALALSAGCESPLVEYDTDLGRRLEPATTRNVRRVKLDQYTSTPAARATDARTTDAPKTPNRLAELERKELTLDDARASALEHNLDLKVAIINPTIAAENLTQERAKFDSTFTTRGLWAETDAPTASTLTSAQSQRIQLDPGVRIPLRTGGTANITIPMARSRDNNAFSTLNPSYSTDVEFSVSQNFLRGAGRKAQNASIRIASYQQQASEARTKLEVIRQLAAVDRGYWSLFQARGELDVRQRQHEVAQEQLERARRRVAAGTVAEIEVIRAEAGLAERLEAIILAENAVLQRQRTLKRVINMPGIDVDTKTLVVPTTPPEPVEYIFDRDLVQQAALVNRMELLELELQIAESIVGVELAKNQALPLFSMDYTYRINGLGGEFTKSWNQTVRNNYEDWSVGLSAEIPLSNEAAKSAVRSAVLQRLQRLGSKQARELSVRQEVLDSLDTIETTWQRVLAARQSSILAGRTLQAEQRQFDVGASTSTDVLDAAARLADSQSAEVRAIADYQVAQVDLAFAAGVLLGSSNVDWVPAPTATGNEPTPAEDLPGRNLMPIQGRPTDMIRRRQGAFPGEPIQPGSGAASGVTAEPVGTPPSSPDAPQSSPATPQPAVQDGDPPQASGGVREVPVGG
jgi:outer membrane protein